MPQGPQTWPKMPLTLKQHAKRALVTLLLALASACGVQLSLMRELPDRCGCHEGLPPCFRRGAPRQGRCTCRRSEDACGKGCLACGESKFQACRSTNPSSGRAGSSKHCDRKRPRRLSDSLRSRPADLPELSSCRGTRCLAQVLRVCGSFGNRVDCEALGGHDGAELV